MLKRKQAGLPPEQQPEAAPPTNVVNLMDALRRSIEGEKPVAGRGKAAERKKPAKEAERRTGKGARKAGRGWLWQQGASSGRLSPLR
jgi:DNA end-binding protein Ku